VFESEKRSSLYKLGSISEHNPCGIFKLGLIGAQPLIAKLKHLSIVEYIFLNFELKKLRNQVKFHLQKSIWGFESSTKSYGQISEKGWNEFFFYIFKHPLWNLSITSSWRLKDLNEFLEMKFILIPQLFLAQSLKKNSTMLNVVWNSTCNTISMF